MKAAPEDRLSSQPGGGSPLKWLLLGVVVILGLAYVWTMSDEQAAMEAIEQPMEVVEVVVDQPALPAAPDIPEPPAPEPVAEVSEPAAPVLPSLAESDPLVREQLEAAGMGPELDKLQGSENLVETGAALIDGFSRGLVLRKLLPLSPPAEVFSVELVDDQLYMNPDGYQRYDGYAQSIETLDTAVLVSSFHLMRPLYEQAYSQLGMDPADFDNSVVRMLDRILSTPEIEAPIALERKSVMYRYLDPALEELSPVQKQLLRMGPDNIRRIKQQAAALRAGLLAQ
jgi:hypothetical protein